jgi:hypothetical protein
LTFDYPGYPLTFIQQQRCADDSAHEYTRIYKFYSPVTRYFYIVRADYHVRDIFAIKFYCKKDRKSEFKYSKIVNRGDLGNIIMSCARVIPMLLENYPAASFAFAASPSVDTKTKRKEQIQYTQRYRLYCYMIPIKFGLETFVHYAYDNISAYLLYNRKSASSKAAIEDMFIATYQTLDAIA